MGLRWDGTLTFEVLVLESQNRTMISALSQSVFLFDAHLNLGPDSMYNIVTSSSGSLSKQGCHDRN